MLRRLLLLLALFCLVELAVLLILAQKTSWLFALGLFVGAGVLGAVLVRIEGIRCLHRIREELNARRMPDDALLDGVLILVAGVLLIIPGLLSDLTAILLLIPPVRRPVRRYLRYRFHLALRPTGGQGGEATRDRIVETRIIETTSEPADEP